LQEITGFVSGSIVNYDNLNAISSQV